MRKEGELDEEMMAGQFRDQMFLHSIASANPKLYYELYDEPDVPEEWEIPESPEDLQRMMAELAAVGVSLNAPPDTPHPPSPAYPHQFDMRPPQNAWNS